MPLTLEQLNAATPEQALALLDGLYEHSPWVAQRALKSRPFKSLPQLKHALVTALSQASLDEKLRLIRAHPELAGKAMVSKTLTAESTNEQGKAGLTDCTPEEFARLHQLNADYNAKFGFPFILAVRGARGLGLNKQQIIDTFARRLHGQPVFEREECLRHINRIAEIRLNDKFGFEPTLGNEVWDWHEDLARHSDPGAHRQGGSRRQDDPRPVEIDPQAPGPGLAQGQGVQGPARTGQEEQAGKDVRRCKQGLRQAAVDEGAHQPVDDPVHCPGRRGQGQGEGHAGTGDRVEDHPGQQEDGHGASPGGQGQKEAGPGQGTCHGRCGLDPTCGSGDPEGEDGPEGGGGRDAEDSRVGQGISRKALQGGTCQAQAGADQHGQ
jgi:OHCU decarboxylase